MKLIKSGRLNDKIAIINNPFNKFRKTLRKQMGQIFTKAITSEIITDLSVSISLTNLGILETKSKIREEN